MARQGPAANTVPSSQTVPAQSLAPATITPYERSRRSLPRSAQIMEAVRNLDMTQDTAYRAEPYRQARALARSPAYAYIEVYSDGELVPVREDGTG